MKGQKYHTEEWRELNIYLGKWWRATIVSSPCDASGFSSQIHSSREIRTYVDQPFLSRKTHPRSASKLRRFMPAAADVYSRVEKWAHLLNWDTGGSRQKGGGLGDLWGSRTMYLYKKGVIRSRMAGRRCSTSLYWRVMVHKIRYVGRAKMRSKLSRGNLS